MNQNHSKFVALVRQQPDLQQAVDAAKERHRAALREDIAQIARSAGIELAASDLEDLDGSTDASLLDDEQLDAIAGAGPRKAHFS